MMNGSFAQFADVRILTVSPDGTIKARYSPHIGVELKYVPRQSVRHDERSLAVQVEWVMKEIRGRFLGAREEFIDSPPRENETFGSKVARERRRRLDAARSEVVTTAGSPAGLVKVGLHAAKGLRVRIRPGACQTRGVEDVIAEANAALRTALSRYQRRVTQIHKEVYVDTSVESLEEYLDERRDQHRGNKERGGESVPGAGR